MKNYKEIENLNNEYFAVYSEDGVVVVHVGMYRVELKNSQVDDLITALKKIKVNK